MSLRLRFKERLNKLAEVAGLKKAVENTHRFYDLFGVEYWMKDGELHREGGPAVIYIDGTESWYQNGKRHREDGPAIIYSSGFTSWYIDDERITDCLYYQKLTGLSDEELMFLILKYGNIE